MVPNHIFVPVVIFPLIIKFKKILFGFYGIVFFMNAKQIEIKLYIKYYKAYKIYFVLNTSQEQKKEENIFYIFVFLY